MKNCIESIRMKRQKGFSLPELVIVVLVLTILVVLALPQIISSTRLFSFAGMRRELATHLNEARQHAMSQREPITFRYDNLNKVTILYGGTFGNLGDSKNYVKQMSGGGLSAADIVYGRPGGVSSATLVDGTDLISLDGNAVEVTYQPDGSVRDASDNPIDVAFFFYHAKYPQDTAFALSILGASGRTKIWRYVAGVDEYVE